jgi:putative oxidoreductase
MPTKRIFCCSLKITKNKITMWKQLKNYSDLGLLIMRLGVGASYVFIHGWPKISGGVERWTGLGQAFTNLIGIEFIPVFWGFLAALSEFLGGILIVLGLLFRPAAAFLLFTMLIATLTHIVAGDPLSTTSHALKMLFVFAGLLFVGPGKYSIDSR